MSLPVESDLVAGAAFVDHYYDPYLVDYGPSPLWWRIARHFLPREVDAETAWQEHCAEVAWRARR